MSVMKRLPIIFLMMFFLIPVGNSADHTSEGHALSSDEEDQRGEAPCVNGECSGSTGDSVAVDDQGWWLTGTLIGQQGFREWVDGILWSSGELEVHTSSKEQLSSYPSFHYSLSVEEQNSELWQGVKDIQDSRSLVFPSEVKLFGVALSVLKVTSFLLVFPIAMKAFLILDLLRSSQKGLKLDGIIAVPGFSVRKFPEGWSLGFSV